MRKHVQPVIGNNDDPSQRDMLQSNDDRMDRKGKVDFEKENRKTALLGNKKADTKRKK